MKQRAGERIKLTSYNDLLGVSDDNMTEEIEIEKIRPFKDHPFKVQMDSKMQDLIDSIRDNGILTPVLVRPVGNDGYEMISGHRRMFAAKKCGLKVLKAVVQEMTDEEATVAMVDANIQREELLPSEKAFAYKMKLEAIKRQGSRSDLTFNQNDRKLDSADVIGKEVGESKAQVRRYIRLTELIPELLELVDAKRFPFMAAVEASYIDKTVQQWLNEYIHEL